MDQLLFCTLKIEQQVSRSLPLWCLHSGKEAEKSYVLFENIYLSFLWPDWVLVVALGIFDLCCSKFFFLFQFQNVNSSLWHVESSSLTRDQAWPHCFGSVGHQGSSEVMSYTEDGKCLGEKAEKENSDVHFSRSVTSNSLQTHEPQHARPSCPSPTP